MIKKIKKLLFGDKEKIEYEEYIRITNCGLDKENLWIKYRGNDYEANNKYYGNGYWFYFKIEENPNGEKELKTYLSGEKEEEFLSIIYRLSDVKIGFVSEKSYKDENGEYKFDGRFNQGVVSLNLPQIGIVAKGDYDVFWKELDERLDICFKALMARHNALKGTLSDFSPVHWQYGGIARLKKGEKIDKYLYGGYSTISLGYIGLYELSKLMTGKSHTENEGKEFALKVLKYLKETVTKWKNETNIGFALYGTPAESLCYRFARIDKERFGDIEDITDKGYYTNSYHVDVREVINAFDKLKFESSFQPISNGGCISYIEIPNMEKNYEALEEIVKFIYDNIQYAEFNTKSDVCNVCGHTGEIIINDDLQWECPCCHNKDESKMSVTRRTCRISRRKLLE